MNTHAQGSVLLSLTTTIFIVALAAAGVVGYLLWRDTNGSWQVFESAARYHTVPQVTPTPSLTNPVLDAQLIVDPTLASETTEFAKGLLVPLRAYYATKAERLGDIRVSASSDDDHDSSVSYDLVTPEGTTTHTFFYDRTGTKQDGPYPVWEPGLLDNTK